MWNRGFIEKDRRIYPSRACKCWACNYPYNRGVVSKLEPLKWFNSAWIGPGICEDVYTWGVVEWVFNHSVLEPGNSRAAHVEHWRATHYSWLIRHWSPDWAPPFFGVLFDFSDGKNCFVVLIDLIIADTVHPLVGLFKVPYSVISHTYFVSIEVYRQIISGHEVTNYCWITVKRWNNLIYLTGVAYQNCTDHLRKCLKWVAVRYLLHQSALLIGRFLVFLQQVKPCSRAATINQIISLSINRNFILVID